MEKRKQKPLTEKRVREIVREEIIKYERENIIAVYGSLSGKPKPSKVKATREKKDE